MVCTYNLAYVKHDPFYARVFYMIPVKTAGVPFLSTRSYVTIVTIVTIVTMAACKLVARFLTTMGKNWMGVAWCCEGVCHPQVTRCIFSLNLVWLVKESNISPILLKAFYSNLQSLIPVLPSSHEQNPNIWLYFYFELASAFKALSCWTSVLCPS